MNSILHQRLHNQLLLDHGIHSPEEVVKHMLCIQSQDFNQHLRAIASRCGCSREDIEQAYNDGVIVKTWTQRGTIHCVSRDDVQWIVWLCASKTLNGFAKRREYLGLDDETLQKALHIIQEALSEKPLSRGSIKQLLESSWINLSNNNRLYHILCYMGTLGLIIQWPIIDGEHLFVLTSKWVGKLNAYSEDEALQQLCIRYFTSHGPATLADLQWWSWLGVTALRKGVELAGDELICRDGLLGRPLVGDFGRTKSTSLQPNIHFLAWFDERLLGYKDRSATLDSNHQTLVDASRNGVFRPTVMIDGKTVAIRSSKEKKNHCEITITPFHDDISIDIEKNSHNLNDYENFIGKKIHITS